MITVGKDRDYFGNPQNKSIINDCSLVKTVYTTIVVERQRELQIAATCTVEHFELHIGTLKPNSACTTPCEGHIMNCTVHRPVAT